MYPDPVRLVFGPKTLSYVENDMARYVSKPGVLPVLVPDLGDERLYPLLQELDAFVFQGGSDVAPSTYKEQPILDGRWMGDAQRDAYELKVMDWAVKHEKPVFGICRGMQLMNVYFGGTLYQDTKTQNPTVMQHRDAQLYDSIYHEIELVHGSFLHELYASSPQCLVNTVHHQAVKEVGNDLEILATSTGDGIIEAIAYTKQPAGHTFGVQWHPEFSRTLGDKVLNADKLMDFFIATINATK